MAQQQRIDNHDNNKQRQDQQAERKPIWTITGTATAIQIFLIITFLLWAFIPDYITNPSDSAKASIESTFSLAIVIVVIVHAMMYYKQAKAMDAQLELSGTALITSNQAYVGIHSIANTETASGKVILITLENIGRVPADEIRINIHLSGLLLDREVIRDGVRPEFSEHVNEHFGRTKLFPGNLKIEIALPYEKYVSDAEYAFIKNNWMALYVWGKIVYKDGFGDGKITEFSFHYSKTGRWLVSAPWSPDVIQRLENQKSSKPKKRDPN
jgi:hypothetical protein